MKKVLPVILILCSISLLSLMGCSLKNSEEDINNYQFTAITENKNTIDDGRQIDIRLIYDNETKMIYYYSIGYYKYSLTPYMRNGHYTYFDLDDGEIKEYV